MFVNFICVCAGCVTLMFQDLDKVDPCPMLKTTELQAALASMNTKLEKNPNYNPNSGKIA